MGRTRSFVRENSNKMNAKPIIKVHITEHHHSVVAGYKLWLGKEADMKLLGTAVHPREALAQLNSNSTQPDVLIMDYSFGEDDNVISFLDEIRKTYPDTAVMVITGYHLPHILRAIHRAGVDGLIIKDDGAEGFIQCIRAIASGGVFFSQSVRKHIEKEAKADVLMRSLSSKQKEVLLQLATGLPDKLLCEELNIAPSTLDNYRTNIYTKLREQGFGVFSKAELVGWYNDHKNDFSGLN